MEHTRQESVTQVRAINREERTIDIVASTFDVDSFGTRIDPNGWELGQFLKNPTILLSHNDRTFPVAKAIPETVRVENGSLLMRIKFPAVGKHKEADLSFELYADGFMRGISVGFDPVSWEDTDEGEGDDRRNIRIYRKQKLLEVSLVTIPSNDNALALRAVKLNADVETVKQRTAEFEAVLSEAPDYTEEDVQIWRGYFERKQPVNKAATKVLEKFYKRILEIEPPENEKAAWEQMSEALDALEKDEEEPVETPEPVVEPVVEPVEETPVVEETPEAEETPEPSNPPVEADPQPERTAYVQIPLEALPHLFDNVKNTCVEAAVTASRRGISKSDWNGVIDATGASLHKAIITHS